MKGYIKIFLILIIALGLFVIIKPSAKQEVNVIKEAKEIKSFAIYKQDASGNYVMSNDTSFPTKGYILNMDKTKCFDSNNTNVSNNIVSQSLDGKITLRATQASYCDLYFIKDDVVPVVTTFSIIGIKENNETLNSGFTHKVNVTYNIKWDATDVVSYCIGTSQSSCNGNWVNVSGTSVSPTEPVLDSTEGKKTRYAFIKDKANNISVGKEAFITLDLNNPTVSNVTYKSKDTSSITVNVTGSDGTTGSGVVKYECKATSKDTWYQQDTNGNCKVEGLSEGTSYTIEGRVTDASGRVSTNSVSTTQSTEAAYTCSVGTREYDESRGSSSGGYICKASASSQGWYNTTTYYTCSLTGSQQYGTKSSAENACKGGEKKECLSSDTYYHCTLELYGNIWTSSRDCESSCSKKVQSLFCEMDEWRGHTQPVCYATSSETTHSFGGFDSMAQCESICKDGGSLTFCRSETVYLCDGSSAGSTSKTTCDQNCVSSDGTVSSHANTSYFCGAGWSTYSGNGSSLQCYKAATKG